MASSKDITKIICHPDYRKEAEALMKDAILKENILLKLLKQQENKKKSPHKQSNYTLHRHKQTKTLHPWPINRVIIPGIPGKKSHL